MRSALILITALVTNLALGPALAGGEAEGNTKSPETGTHVEMPLLIAPMSSDGKLQGYAYISSKMVCSSTGAAILVRQKLGFIQDSFVREVNAKPIGQATDPLAVDKVQLNLRLSAAAQRIVGERKVLSMLFVDIKYNPLHPSQSTVEGQVPPDQAAPQKPVGEGGKQGEGAATEAQGTSKPSKDNAVGGESPQKSHAK